MRVRPLRSTATALAFLSPAPCILTRLLLAVTLAAGASGAPVIGAYVTNLDAGTFTHMAAANVTLALVAFATVHTTQPGATSGACDVQMAATGWNKTAPRHNLTTLLSFGGAETESGCNATAGNPYQQFDATCQGRAFLSDPESAGAALGNYAAGEGFDGIDFDIELSGDDQTKGVMDAGVCETPPCPVTTKLADFLNATVRAFRDARGRMPVVAVNPPVYYNITRAWPVVAAGPAVPLLIRAVKLMLDWMDAADRAQLLKPEQLLLSMQFYNCWVPPAVAGKPSRIECQGEGGRAFVKDAWQNITAIFAQKPDPVNVTGNLILGKPMSDCCTSKGAGGRDYCNDDIRFRIGGGSACAPFCTASGSNLSEPLSIAVKPVATCGFENASTLSGYWQDAAAPVLGFKAAGVFLWRWNLLYGQAQSCAAPQQFTAALNQRASNETQLSAQLRGQVKAGFAQWQRLESMPPSDDPFHCSVDKLCPASRPCCMALQNGGRCGLAEGGFCDAKVCLPFQSASPGACDGSVWEICGADVPKPSLVVAQTCSATHWIGSSSSLASSPQLLSVTTCNESCTAYDRARTVFNRDADNSPCFIFNCTTTNHVSQAMTFAHKHSIRVVVRAGGNSFEGYSTCDGNCIIIDVSGLKGHNISADTRAAMSAGVGIARVGAGSNNGDLYEALGRQQLSAVSGTCYSVGFAGLTLGGGIGILMRKHGLAADNVIGLEVVLFNGTVVYATESENPDLFWAMRGGGNGNFGVATHFTIRVFDTTDQVWQIRQYSANFTSSSTELAAAFVSWQAWVANLSDSGYSQYHMNRYSMNDPRHGFTLVWNGTLASVDAELKKGDLLDHFSQSVGRVSEDKWIDCGAVGRLSQNLTWNETVQCLGLRDCGTQKEWASPGAYSRFAFPHSSKGGTAVPFASALAMVQAFGDGGCDGGKNPCYTSWADVLVDGLGGQVGRRAGSWSAFAHREAALHLQYNAYWNVSDFDAFFAKPVTSAFLHSVYASTNDTISSYAYRNYPQVNLTGYGRKYYGDNYPHLQQVKAAYDPSNKFWYSQSIELPAGPSGDLWQISKDNGTYAYFTQCDCTAQGCTEREREHLVDACRKDLLLSPFDTIIFGFANGDDADPFHLDVDFRAVGVLSASFVDALRDAGKRAVLSFGGGDGIVTQVDTNGGTTWSYKAVPRTFTALWNASKSNSGATEDWAKSAVAFASGNNSESVVFDGIE
jgi:FAD/FMN-containing dehydrogenase